jgi:TRAP transporter TAXI family solute receptor
MRRLPLLEGFAMMRRRKSKYFNTASNLGIFMKKKLFGLVLGLAMMCGAYQDASAGYKFIVFGTAGERGVYYPVGGTICRMVKRKIKEHGIRCTVESTGGSIYNLNAIREKELDIGFAQSDWQYNAYKGAGLFADQGPNEKLRSLFSLHSEAFTIVARDKSGIKTFEDLKGHRVNIGNPGSGMRATMDELMKVKGWNKSVFKAATEYSAADQAQKLCTGLIDAFVFATGHPNGEIQEVTSKCPSHLISVPKDVVDALVKEHPYYAEAIIPGGMYKGNPDPTSTFGVKATVVASEDTDPEIIYQVVKAVFDDFDNFKTTHPILSTLNKQKMISNGLTAPLHEGALRYYREAGLLGK